MTDYALVRSTVEPKEIDTESSPNTVYLNRYPMKNTQSCKGGMEHGSLPYFMLLIAGKTLWDMTSKMRRGSSFLNLLQCIDCPAAGLLLKLPRALNTHSSGTFLCGSESSG